MIRTEAAVNPVEDGAPPGARHSHVCSHDQMEERRCCLWTPALLVRLNGIIKGIPRARTFVTRSCADHREPTRGYRKGDRTGSGTTPDAYRPRAHMGGQVRETVRCRQLRSLPAFGAAAGGRRTRHAGRCIRRVNGAGASTQMGGRRLACAYSTRHTRHQRQIQVMNSMNI